jgi:hypothetical protein
MAHEASGNESLEADGVLEWSRVGPRNAQVDELSSAPMATVEAAK